MGNWAQPVGYISFSLPPDTSVQQGLEFGAEVLSNLRHPAIQRAVRRTAKYAVRGSPGARRALRSIQMARLQSRDEVGFSINLGKIVKKVGKVAGKVATGSVKAVGHAGISLGKVVVKAPVTAVKDVIAAPKAIVRAVKHPGQIPKMLAQHVVRDLKQTAKPVLAARGDLKSTLGDKAYYAALGATASAFGTPAAGAAIVAADKAYDSLSKNETVRGVASFAESAAEKLAGQGKPKKKAKKPLTPEQRAAALKFLGKTPAQKKPRTITTTGTEIKHGTLVGELAIKAGHFLVDPNGAPGLLVSPEGTVTAGTFSVQS